MSDPVEQAPVKFVGKEENKENNNKHRKKKKRVKSERDLLRSQKHANSKSSTKKTEKVNELKIFDEISLKNYQNVCLLGVGSQGRVYLVRVLHSDQYYAMKVFEKFKILPNEKTTRSILTEHRFLATTDHPFITKLYHSFQSYERLFMVMEFCPGGELFSTIRKQPYGRLTESQVHFYSSEVVLVLEYIHSRGYIYRDLKPENILLHTDGHIRMADFGLSKQSENQQPTIQIVEKKSKYRNPFSKKKFTVELQQGGVLRTSSLVGSLHYLAPEVVSGESYDAMADWWSFGVLLYDMLFGFPPFQGRNNREILNKISTGDFDLPSDIPISSNLKSLIKKLLRTDPTKRLGSKNGSSDIKRHPFFANVNWGLLRNRVPPIIPNISGPADTTNFEVFPGDEDSIDFNFFSDLSEDPTSIPFQEQSKFEEFNFKRETFSCEVKKLFRFDSEKATKLSIKEICDRTPPTKLCLTAREERIDSPTHFSSLESPIMLCPKRKKKKKSKDKYSQTST